MKPPAVQLTREITIHIEDFITRLRRGQVTESKDIAVETMNLMRHVVSLSRWDDIETLLEIIQTVGRQLLKALPRELLIVNVLCRLLRLVKEESET
ncbi:Translation initiation factor eIF-2B subunit beta, partial [Coemansia sp. RSA 1290]